MKIKIKEVVSGCMPEILKVGDCIDLRTATECIFKGPHANVLHKQRKGETIERFRDVVFDYALIDLGVIIELPKGFEAVLMPRSSSFKKWGIIQTNSIGEIDGSYCGPTDIWRMPVLATRNVTIPKGKPIAQFRIQPSQKATMWQKLKWLFSSKIELVKIDDVHNPDRGGFGEGSDMYRTQK